MSVPERAAMALGFDLRKLLVGAAVLLFLNTLLSFENRWPTPAIQFDLRLAPEFVAVWVLLWIITGRSTAPGRTAFMVITVLYLLLILGRYGDVTVPALFGRPLNLYWDGHQIPTVLAVLARKLPWWLPPLLAGSLLLFLVVLYKLLSWAIRYTAVVVLPAVRGSFLARGLTVLAVFLVVLNTAGVQATWPWVSKPVTPTYVRQAGLLLTAFSPQLQAVSLPASPDFDRNLAVLDRADVTILYLESYGSVVFDDPGTYARLASHRQRLAQSMTRDGQTVVSAMMRSPTFGGGSELAHLGFLSGIDLRDPFVHDLLMTTDRPTLVTHFQRHGYEVYGLYPALSWDWPEKSFYRFDVFLDVRDLDYRGPQFGPWWIPDQIAVARFEHKHPILPKSPPRLLIFPTIMSHIPFAPVPPYQPDWQRLLSNEPFDPADLASALSFKPNWLQLLPDFQRSIAYTYDWLADYLRRPRARDTVYILMGDHQPASSVSGPGARWDVPVHIVTRNTTLLNRLRAAGFSDGLEPARESLGSLHDLTAWLVEMFDSRGCDHPASQCRSRP